MNIDHSRRRIQPIPWCLFQEAHPGCQPFSTIPYWNSVALPFPVT